MVLETFDSGDMEYQTQIIYLDSLRILNSNFLNLIDLMRVRHHMNNDL